MSCFKRMKNKMKDISPVHKKMDKVIMHCAATPDADPTNPRWYNLDISEIREWHVKGNGWRDVGYHFFIKRDGTIQEGRPVGTQGAHTKGQNENIGVCYAGSKDPTKEQKESIRALGLMIRQKYGISPLDWHCHYEYANKDCPGFSRQVLLDILTG